MALQGVLHVPRHRHNQKPGLAANMVNYMLALVSPPLNMAWEPVLLNTG